jgi:hypothetical protein
MAVKHLAKSLTLCLLVGHYQEKLSVLTDLIIMLEWVDPFRRLGGLQGAGKETLKALMDQARKEFMP